MIGPDLAPVEACGYVATSSGIRQFNLLTCSMDLESAFKLSFSFLAALILAAQSKPAAFAQENELRIGFMAELSGQYSANGNDCVLGYKAALERFAPGGIRADYRIKALYGDTQRDPKVALAEFRKMVEVDKVLVIVANSSPVAMALRPLSDRKLFPIVVTSGHSDFLVGAKAAFRFWPTAVAEGKKLAQAALRQGLKNVAIITTEDDWLMSFSQGFRDAYAEYQSGILLDQIIQKSDRDYSSLMVRIRHLKPAAVLVDLGIGQAGLFIRRLREQGYRGIILGNYFAVHPSELEIAGDAAAEGLIFVEPDFEHPDFLETFKRVAGGEIKPRALSYACYVSAAFVLQAVPTNHALTTPIAVLRVLDKIKSVDLIDHSLPLEGREAIIPERIRVLRKGNRH